MTNLFQNAQQRDKIIERIQKLLATSKGTPYEGEAQTALRMAQDFMAKYGLSLSEVEMANELKEEIVQEELTEHANHRVPEHWERLLAVAVGTVFDVKSIRRTRRTCEGIVTKMVFIGFKKDVELAKVVFETLYVATRAAACLQFPDGAGRVRLSFMYGVAERLCERAKQEKEKAKEEPTGKYGLMVLEKDKRVDLWCEQHMHLSHAKATHTTLDGDAYRQGK